MLSKACCCFRSLFRRSDLSPIIDGSDLLHSHRTAIGDWTRKEVESLRMVDIDNSSKHMSENLLSSQIQLIYSNVTNSTKIKPYAVFYDAFIDEVVIAIRGTLSLEDCITDAMAIPVKFNSKGLIREDTNHSREYDGEKVRWAHEGMLLCALAIKEDIEKKQILDNNALGRLFDSTSPLMKVTTRLAITVFNA